jgi:hypothetical protein
VSSRPVTEFEAASRWYVRCILMTNDLANGEFAPSSEFRTNMSSPPVRNCKFGLDTLRFHTVVSADGFLEQLRCKFLFLNFMLAT